MRDWTGYVRERLGALRLSRRCKDEIAEEIGGHLEEIAEAHRRANLDEEEAHDRALREVGDWRVLCREVQKAKEDGMRKLLRTVVVPGMVAFVLAGLIQRALFEIGVWPRMLHFGKFGWVTFNWVWLVAVVCCGGISAYLSRRAGGTAKQRIQATLFPVGLVGVFIIITAAATLLFRAARGNVGVATIVVVEGMAGYLTGFVVIPALALMLGALPFLRGNGEAEDAHDSTMLRA